MSNYHGRIMNIPSDVEGMSNPSRVIYKTGHRDARHAAAEIAAEADGVIEELYEALENIVTELEETGCQGEWDSYPQARAALTKARGEQS